MGRKKDEPEYVSVLGQWPKVLRDRLRKAVGARQMTATTIAIVEKWLDENEPRLMEERREARRAAEQRRAASAEPPEAGESRAASEVTIEGEQSSERAADRPRCSRCSLGGRGPAGGVGEEVPPRRRHDLGVDGAVARRPPLGAEGMVSQRPDGDLHVAVDSRRRDGGVADSRCSSRDARPDQLLMLSP